MAEQDDIIQFNEGDKLTIEETNHNNLLLKGWALDNSASQAYINTKMAELSTSLNASITSINTQISSLNNQISGLNNSALKQTAFSKSNNGYLKMSNGLIIQWGYFTAPSYRTTKEIPLNTAFTNDNYKVFYGGRYAQTAGEKGSSCATRSKSNNKFVFYSGFEGSTPTVYYFAIGY